MSRLLVVTQQVDPAHPVLAATVPMLRALAERVDRLTVLALRGDPAALPANCDLRLFGAGSKLGRGLRYERLLARELRPRPLAVFAHMCPIYAVLAAPLARPQGVPVLLWFTHWRRSPTLRLAGLLVNGVLSVDRRSAPLRADTVQGIGHGIDLEEFPCQQRPEPGPRLRLLALGRYSPAKGLPVVLEAIARSQAELVVHGSTNTGEERQHRRELESLVERLGLGGRVLLGDALPRSELPALLAGCDALVNNMRPGAPDKVVYEAAASCAPVLASNPVFDDLLPAELRFDRDSPDSLVRRLETLATLSPEQRTELGRALRTRVAEAHSVGHWADAVLAVAREAAGRAAGSR
ncbi:MAG: glycosyltransferase family 4 protein [Gaiellaceae bacterium]